MGLPHDMDGVYKMLRMFLALFCLLLPFSGAQAAASSRDQTAQMAKLKTIFQNIMDQQVKSAEGKATITYDGPLTVEPAQNDQGPYYAVTLPRATIKYPAGDHLELGILSVNATPSAKAGEWNMTFALPTTITGYDAQDTETMRLAIGTQKAGGIWNEALENFTTFDATYGKLLIDFTAPKMEKSQIDIPALTLSYKITENADHRWSGPFSFEILNTGWNAPAQSVTGRLEKLALHSTFDQLSPELLKGLKTGTPQTISATLEKAWNGLDMALSISGLHSTAKADSVDLSHATLRVGFKDVLSGTMSASHALSFDGFKIAPLKDDLGKLIPEHGAFETSFKNIPIDLIAKTLANGAPGKDPSMAGAMFLKIPALLSQAGTTIGISNTKFHNALYDMTLEGLARADISAANGATADITLGIKGLDGVTSLLQSPAAQQNGLSGIAGVLTALKSYSSSPDAKDDGTTHVFKAKMDETGAFTVNGKDATMLLFSGMIPQTSTMPAVPPPAVTP